MRGGGFPIVLDEVSRFFRRLVEDLAGVYVNDPSVFLTVLFIYAILTALILPIPVEFALLPLIRNPAFLGTAAVVLGVGKAVGAGAIFLVGLRVEGPIRYWCARHPSIGRFVGYVTRFVRATRWGGLMFLLSIPFFPDTLPIYLYSLFNKQGQLIGSRVFLLVNFAAGILRAIVFVILSQMGIQFLLG